LRAGCRSALRSCRRPPSVGSRIRYNHPGTSATITPLPLGRASVKLKQAQRAVTPGQAAVFYREDLVLGGGWILPLPRAVKS